MQGGQGQRLQLCLQAALRQLPDTRCALQLQAQLTTHLAELVDCPGLWQRQLPLQLYISRHPIMQRLRHPRRVQLPIQMQLRGSRYLLDRQRAERHPAAQVAKQPGSLRPIRYLQAALPVLSVAPLAVQPGGGQLINLQIGLQCHALGVQAQLRLNVELLAIQVELQGARQHQPIDLLGTLQLPGTCQLATLITAGQVGVYLRDTRAVRRPVGQLTPELFVSEQQQRVKHAALATILRGRQV